MLSDPFHGLFLDPGLGKTLIMLAAIDLLRRDLEISSALVIAPLRVCYTTWPEEARKWASHLRVSNLHGNIRTDIAADIYTINPHSIGKLFGRPVEVVTGSGNKRRVWEKGPWSTWADRPEMLICDESTLWKNPRSKRSQILRAVLGDFSRRVILTGTPAPNGLMDLYGQMLVLDRGELLGDKISHFRERFFKETMIGARGKKFPQYSPKESSFETVKTIIAPRVTALEADDWIELPDRIVADIPVLLPQAVHDKYVEAKGVIELEDGKQIDLQAAAIKLKQIVNGRVYTSDPISDKREVVELHDEKVKALEEFLAELNAPCLVAYEFQCDGDALADRFKAPRICGGMKEAETLRIFDKWNSGKMPVLLVQPQAMSHGVNLQAGGHHIVWYSLPYSLETYIQLNARLARQGQKSAKVFIHHLVARGTVDARVAQILQDKAAEQADIVAALKAEIET